MVEDATTAAPTAQNIVGSQYTTSFDLNGSTLRTASMAGLRTQTSYILYAVVVSDGQHSQVAKLAVTTM